MDPSKHLLLVLLLLAPLQSSAQEITVDGGRGPVAVNVPPSYDPDVPTPLVMLLHGYNGTAQGNLSYTQMAPLSDERGFLLIYPEGLSDRLENAYWNATDACCDVFDVGNDDSTYLRGLIEEVQATLNVDSNRIYLTGHSNGAFMSYRMACDHADLIAAIAPLSGVTFLDEGACSPSEPVSVLHMHGTRDPVIWYQGGRSQEAYPSAHKTLEYWSRYNGCEGGVRPLGRFDYDGRVEGDETRALAIGEACPEGIDMELWRMEGTYHSPDFTDQWNDDVVDWLLAHEKE